MNTIAESLAGGLPDDVAEFRQVPPDGASLDGTLPTLGLPLESSRMPDQEVLVGGDELGALLADGARVAGELLFAGGQLTHISGAGLGLIEGFEGFSPVQYRDSVGVPTIGYGTTAADIDPLPTHCTRAQAEGWLRAKMASKYEPAVRGVGVALNQHQFDALCSFVYNLGPGALSSSWTIGRLLRAREYRQAADSLLMYNHAGNVVLLGLQRRRQAERTLFLEPMPAVADPHHYGRFVNAVLIDGYNERGTVEEFDRLLVHRDRAERQLHELQAGIVQLRKRDWAVAHQDSPSSWPLYWRGWRWQELNRRSNVKL